MPHSFAQLTFTPAVRAQQTQQGSAKSYAKFLESEQQSHHQLGPMESAFIGLRDGFYQSTISETGWPYVQFRGGPAGFVKALDEHTIAYADYRGNRQYITTGNLTKHDRISLILMDYPGKRRLKILGTASTISIEEDEALVTNLMPKGYKATPERAIIIKVNAFDWNCPQHIPERLSPEELAPIFTKYEDEITRLHKENIALTEQLETQNKS